MSDNIKYPKSLIAIGYWQSRWNPELPNPHDFVNDQVSPDEKRLLADYLDRGTKVMAFLGYSYCRFNCGTPEYEMGNKCLTDGKYIWPGKLSHYIQQHNVWLPEPFILPSKENQNYIFLEADIKKTLNPYDQIVPKEYDIYDYEWWNTYKTLK